MLRISIQGTGKFKFSEHLVVGQDCLSQHICATCSRVIVLPTRCAVQRHPIEIHVMGPSSTSLGPQGPSGNHGHHTWRAHRGQER